MLAAPWRRGSRRGHRRHLAWRWNWRWWRFPAPSPGPDPGQPTSEEVASVLADVLTEGVRPTLADRLASRVVDYMGSSWRLPKRWGSGDCRLLAETARAVLDLKKKAHEAVGEGISRLLPPDTPRFHRTLVKRIAEKVPLPWDAKLEAIARGLQVIGIYLCFVRNVPLEHCACLRMLGPQLVKEQVKRYIEDLLEETERDLSGKH
jgi:hypothetical protein